MTRILTLVAILACGTAFGQSADDSNDREWGNRFRRNETRRSAEVPSKCPPPKVVYVERWTTPVLYWRPRHVLVAWDYYPNYGWVPRYEIRYELTY
jgi:hypothetical protein